MNIEICDTKRKKRKTRKWLNDIRRRSKNYSNRFVKDHVCENKCKELDPNKNNNNITKNRLTLSLFPKAIRSDTITRPILEEMKHKQNLNDILRDNNSLSICKHTTVKNQFEIVSDELQNSSDDVLEVKEVHHNDKSAESPIGSFVLVSPVYLGKQKDVPQLNEKEMWTSSKIPYSQKLFKKNSELYRSFMEEHNLDKFFPEDFFKLNILKYMQAQLSEICTEQLNTSTNMIASGVSHKSTRNVFIQDPMEYIRMAHQSPDNVTKSDNPTSPCIRHKYSDSQQTMPSPQLLWSSSLVQGTPEYNYYPHKLHQ